MSISEYPNTSEQMPMFGPKRSAMHPARFGFGVRALRIQCRGFRSGLELQGSRSDGFSHMRAA